MSDIEHISDKMAEMQKLRIAVVTLLCQENCKLLSRRQRLAGNEIEVMCAERDLAGSKHPAAAQAALNRLYLAQNAARQALTETEHEAERLESLLARISADISALCHS